MTEQPTIERCSRKFRKDENGVTAYYVGYDLEGNEVAELTSAEFRDWLKAGFHEYMADLAAGGGE